MEEVKNSKEAKDKQNNVVGKSKPEDPNADLIEIAIINFSRRFPEFMAVRDWWMVRSTLEEFGIPPFLEEIGDMIKCEAYIRKDVVLVLAEVRPLMKWMRQIVEECIAHKVHPCRRTKYIKKILERSVEDSEVQRRLEAFHLRHASLNFVEKCQSN